MSKKNYRMPAALAAMIIDAGFDVPWKLLLSVPVRYDAQLKPLDLEKSIENLVPGVVVVRAKVDDYAEQISTFPPIISLLLKAKNSCVNAYFDGFLDQNNPLSKLNSDDEIAISGVLSSDKFHIFNASLHLKGPLIAQYKGKGKGVNKKIPQITNRVFFNFLSEAEKNLLETFDVLKKHELISYMNTSIAGVKFNSLKQFFLSLHFPFTNEEGQRASHAAANLAALDCCIRAKKASVRPMDEKSVIDIPADVVSRFIAMLPFTLTGEQKKAMADIWRDLSQPYAMNRLVSGDVGTGKTAVLAVMAVAAQSVGKKIAIFTPNGLLTDQFYNELRSWFPDVTVLKITKDSKPDPTLLSKNPILIGTHAILGWAKTNNFVADWLIVDEQQKSSRAQRESLLHPHTNILEATATCLPRTFGLMLYGGMKISVIKQQPVVKNLITKIVYESEKQEIFAYIKSTVLAGDKVAVILPLVTQTSSEDEPDIEQDKLAVESALPYWESAFPGKVIGLHGKMKEQEKLDKLNQIKTGTDKSIIVATTLIEIGVTIKNLRHIVVIEADRYGLSTLHQMRGRLARNGGDGMMHLLLKKTAEQIKETTLTRLQVMEKTTCGFELTEADAKNRGWGDLAQDSNIQAGDVVTLFKNILIPHETISTIQNLFESNHH